MMLKLLTFLTILLPSPSVAQMYEEKLADFKNKLENIPPGEIELSYAYIDSGLTLSRKTDNQKFIASFLQKKGNLFVRTNPDLAMSCFYEALHISESVDDKKGMAISLSNIGSFANPKGPDNLTYLYKACSLFQEVKDTIGLINVYNNIGAYILKTSNNLDSAILYFRKSKVLSEKRRHIKGVATSNLNLGVVSYIFKKNYKNALDYLYKAKVQMPKDETEYIAIIANIMNFYFEINNIDSAMHYYTLVERNFDQRPDIEANVYSSLSNYYAKTQDLPNALEFDAKSDSVKEFIRSRNNENQLKLLELEYNSKIKEESLAKLNAEVERSEIIRLALGVLLLLSIVFSYILLHQQRQKAEKKRALLKAEQELTRAKLENSELQRRTLNEELKFTNKELSSFAASIIKNSDHLHDLKYHLNLAFQEKNPKKVKDQLRELNIKINQLFHKDEERKEFIKRTRQINHSLIFFLKSKYPQLSDSDLNLLVLMILKFSSKEISVLYSMEVTSVRTKRSRLRKKMGLKDRENFDHFIDGIIEDFKAVH